MTQNVNNNETAGRVDLRYVSLAVGSDRANYDIAFSRIDNLGATALKLTSDEAAGIEGTGSMILILVAMSVL